MVRTFVSNDIQCVVWVNLGNVQRDVPATNENILAMNRRSGERREVTGSMWGSNVSRFLYF